jgi:pyrimidine deaminase RibD-like protein/RNA-binding protein YhbY
MPQRFVSVIMTAIALFSLLRRSLAFQPARQAPANRRFLALFTSAADDVKFMDLAIQHAQNAIGKTFPNPLVGCVLVNQETNEIIGQGFHPRAGFPHAEVFALLQAAGHVPDGVEAAKRVVNDDLEIRDITKLSDLYKSQGGSEKLFGNIFADKKVTAYVTLEPCCHHGRTPPCASALTLAKVDRVLVGFHDPNPRVDGGGIKVLQDHGVAVDVADGEMEDKCLGLVENFAKRIMPRAGTDYETSMNGAKRVALRSYAARKKADKTIVEQEWPRKGGTVDDLVDLEVAVAALQLDPTWMENVDTILWKEEVVLLRLGNAVSKKKGAKILGERIAEQLNAHVAEVKGHTALMYRPAFPPILNLDEMVKEVRILDKEREVKEWEKEQRRKAWLETQKEE